MGGLRVQECHARCSPTSEASISAIKTDRGVRTLSCAARGQARDVHETADRDLRSATLWHVLCFELGLLALHNSHCQQPRTERRAAMAVASDLK